MATKRANVQGGGYVVYDDSFLKLSVASCDAADVMGKVYIEGIGGDGFDGDVTLYLRAAQGGAYAGSEASLSMLSAVYKHDKTSGRWVFSKTESGDEEILAYQLYDVLHTDSTTGRFYSVKRNASAATSYMYDDGANSFAVDTTGAPPYISNVYHSFVDNHPKSWSTYAHYAGIDTVTIDVFGITSSNSRELAYARLDGTDHVVQLSGRSATHAYIEGVDISSVCKGKSLKFSVSVVQDGGSAEPARAEVSAYLVNECPVYSPPTVSNATAARCNASWELDDNGTQAIVTFDWTNASPEKLSYSVTALGQSTTGTTEAGNNGTGTDTVAAPAVFDTNTTHDIEVTVSDGWASASAKAVLPAAFFAMDVLEGGHGVSFGSAALHEGFNVSMLPYVFERQCMPCFTVAAISQHETPGFPCLVLDTSTMGLYYDDGN